MSAKKINAAYVIAFVLLIIFIVLLVFFTNSGAVQLSLPLYFFLLVICDLGATFFLASVLKSSAEYSGNVLKGNLKITGPAVIFLVILLIGYKYKPIEKEDPFDLTFIVSYFEKGIPEKQKGSIRIELDNNPRELPVDEENKVVFTNIDHRYLGKMIPVSSNIPGFTISTGKDTLIKIPDNILPVIRLSLNKLIDSTLFSGYVFKKNQKGPPLPVKNATLNFMEFGKIVNSDDEGFFKIYLPSKTGDNSNLVIMNNGKWLFSDRVVLSDNMQILVDDN
jgi:hypothetical protein